MTTTNGKLKVLVAYNKPASKHTGNNIDFLSEEAVQSEASAVYQALQQLNYVTDYLPLSDLDEGLQRIRGFHPHIIFNLCEGFRGNAQKEMHVAGLWELLDLAYTGNTPFTLGLAQNKILTKKLFEAKKIPTPPYQVYVETPKITYLEFPMIAKPAFEDGSVGITQKSVVWKFEELQQVVNNLLAKYQQPVLIEKFIEGREFNISILGNQPARVLPISEISFTGLEQEYAPITSYEAKWLNEHPLYQKTPAICPADVPEKLKRRLEDTALQVYQILSGRDYGRVDVRVDHSDHIHVLEYNPNPDISLDAGFSRSLKAAGMKYEEFIDFLVHQASNRMTHDHDS